MKTKRVQEMEEKAKAEGGVCASSDFRCTPYHMFRIQMQVIKRW